MSTHESNKSHPGYETADADIRLIARAAIGLVVVTIACVFIALWAFRLLEKQRAAQDPVLSPLAPKTQIAPEPRLQATPKTFVTPGPNDPFASQKLGSELRARQDEMLNSYGWINEEQGIVHIPIEQAKKQILKKGLPTRPAEVAQ